MMKFKIIILLLLTIILNSCDFTKPSKKVVPTREDMIENAVKATKLIEEIGIDKFQNWYFFTRGKGKVWSKHKQRTLIYKANYFKLDSVVIIHQYYNADLLEFPLKFKIDTAKYKRIKFYQFSNGLTNVTTEYNNKKIVLGKNMKVEDVFVDENPFTVLGEFSKIMDECKIYSLTHNAHGYIHFKFLNRYVLTYIPDKTKHDTFWINKFSKGIMINKNWNIWQDEEPKAKSQQPTTKS